MPRWKMGRRSAGFDVGDYGFHKPDRLAGGDGRSHLGVPSSCVPARAPKRRDFPASLLNAIPEQLCQRADGG
jgi:hypothetical protein